jgi:hypothetical protein
MPLRRSPCRASRRARASLPPVGGALLLAAVALAASACGGDTTGYEGPYAPQVRRAIPKIEASTGLKFKAPPKLEERTRDDVRAYLERQFNEQLTPLEIAGTQEAYRLFGLLPDTLDLRSFLLDLLAEQVAGYYDPQTKVLYIVSDAAPEIRGITIDHELVHALQDQHVALDSVRTLKGDNDRQVAMQAVVEGQATYEQMASLLGGDEMGLRMPSGWDRVREVIRSAQASMPRFASAPMILQETLLFPYLSGAEFVRQFKRARPGEAPFTPFASSTEQILHPERYLDSIPDLPTRVTLGAPLLGSVIHEDNLGEFETRIFLYEHLRDSNRATAAADGWDGDRYQVVETRAGAALAWVTIWDSAVEAAEFRDAMERLVERRWWLDARSGGDGAVRRWTPRGRRVTLAAETIDGRPAVIYEDAPQAITGRILAVERVRLEGGR